MRSFVPCYKVVFSGDVSIGRRSVIFPDGRLFNTRYTEETHSGAALYLSNIFLCRPQKNKDSIERLAEEAGKFRF